MAFVCTASHGGFSVEILGACPVSVTVIHIGRDDAAPIKYTAVVGLDVLPGSGHELYVQIVGADGATGSEHLF